MTDSWCRDTFINGVLVVATPEEIDVTTADQLRAALLQAIGDRNPVVVVDMTSTRFCDSAGLNTVLTAYQRAQAEGRELRVVLPAGGPVLQVFTLTGIDRFVPCFASLQAALGP